MRAFETIAELRLALLEFKRTYSEHWMLEKYDYRSPAPSPTRSRRTGRGSVGTNRVKPLSKNPEAVHRGLPTNSNNYKPVTSGTVATRRSGRWQR